MPLFTILVYLTYTMTYKKGLHLIADIETSNPTPLMLGYPFMEEIMPAIQKLGLNVVGTVVHDFTNGGFTISICLTESHICVHTWPEFGKVTLDIFLSNNYHINDNKGRLLLEITKHYFNAEAVHLHEIYR
jgi:S-adenosylmethionine decarboxylase